MNKRAEIGMLFLAAALLLFSSCTPTVPANVTAPAESLFLTATPSTTAEPTIPPSFPPPLATPARSALSTSTPGQPDQSLTAAIADLASRFNLPTSAIKLVKTYSDEFPIDNLGCPAPLTTPKPLPGIVSGQVIILEANNQTYTYHARQNRVVFCGKTE